MAKKVSKAKDLVAVKVATDGDFEKSKEEMKKTTEEMQRLLAEEEDGSIEDGSIEDGLLKNFNRNIEIFEEDKDIFREVEELRERFDAISKDGERNGKARGVARRAEIKLAAIMKEMGFPSMFKMVSSIEGKEINESLKIKESVDLDDIEEEENDGVSEKDEDENDGSGYAQ